MQFIGLILILIGVALLEFVLKNRPPVQTIKALLDDPSDLQGTLKNFEGKWESITIYGTVTNPPSTEKKGSGSTGNKTSGTSGLLKDSELKRLSWNNQHKLVPEAAAALERLNLAYKEEFRKNISITDSYRSYAQQVAVKNSKGYLAAKPGTSNHGWGKAVDLGGGIQRFDSREYKWMLANAPRFGWDNPAWARQNGTKPEAWHFEYTGR